MSAPSGAQDAASKTPGDKPLSPLSPLSFRQYKYGHVGDGDDQRKPPERWGGLSSSPASRGPDTSLGGREKLPSPSAALSEFVGGLRRQRAQRGPGAGLGLEAWPTLPIYQTTGASALRRATRAGSDEGHLSLRSPLETEDGTEPSAGLLRSASLKCLPSQGREGASPLPQGRKTRFSSCESLLESGPGLGRKPSSPSAPRDTLLSPTLRPRRRCLEASLDDGGCPELGKEPLVFQNRQFAHLMAGDPPDSDPFSWKLPSLNYERRAKVDFDDFLPAIRKPEASRSLAGATKDGPDGSRHPSVHFETEEADRTFLSGMKTILKKSPESKEDPGHLSDSSSSSSSIVSFKSADSIKSRPRVPRPKGEDGEPASPGTGEPGTARQDEDVASIMKKYLQK